MAVNNDGSCFQVFTRDTKSKVISGGSGASVIAGVIIIGLGALAVFGPLGSPGFAGLMAGGGVLVIGGTSGIIIIAVKNSRNTNATVRVNGEEYELTFFDDKSQGRAKQVFTEKRRAHLRDVQFPKACRVDNLEALTGNLNQAIFKYSATTGVQNDIPRSSRDENNRHIYQVASQYNAAEAPGRFTPGIARAMAVSANDRTQGPLAQRTNPEAFEEVTAFLTHLGFNMLNQVLSEDQTTFAEGSVVEHGYLCPTDENIANVTNAFKENYEHAEYVSYESKSEAWEGAINSVYIMLQAAPAIGYSQGLNANTNELQQYAALANYLALFQEGIRLAQQHNQPVVIHVAAVGLGVFGNAVENVKFGFQKAALHFQEQMVQHNVKVQLECFGNNSPLQTIAQNLNIQQGDRIGD